ncbi:MAG TPA: ABC transporter permease, partial [Planctomycetes bacterium]|nr:ABC transporter permease [Planctomycetota bacterium]
MTLDFEITPFGDWVGIALLSFGITVVIGALLAAFLSYVFCAIRHGPIEAFYIVGQTGAAAIPDFIATSPRRVIAIARLAFKEAMRRRVWVSLVVFFIVLLYAQWFLDQGSEHPGKLHIAFVMTATSYLVLGLSLFLSTFSLPDDIKNRTIYTVVTKPVRPNEIVMGRILGFAGIGSLLILVMCLTSLAFVVRGLHHTHTLSSDLKIIMEDIETDGFWQGQT